MEKEPINRLQWHDGDTMARAADLIAAREPFEIAFPPELHHSLFRHLYPDADPGALENVDLRDGPELLAHAAETHGLEDLSALQAAVTEAGAHIHILSPAPRLIVDFG